MNMNPEIESYVMEVTNEYGFLQFEWSDQPGAVCCQCHAYIRPNRGQGCICSTCENEFNAHCAADEGMY